MSDNGSRAARAARWVGPLGLVLVAVVPAVPDRSIGLLIADVGLALLIGLTLSAHLRFHRRRHRDDPDRTTIPGGTR